MGFKPSSFYHVVRVLRYQPWLQRFRLFTALLPCYCPLCLSASGKELTLECPFVFSPTVWAIPLRVIRRTPSQTGILGHLAQSERPFASRRIRVTIPNGYPRPFSPNSTVQGPPALPVSPSQTGILGHLASGTSNIAWEANLCKHLREAPQKGLFGEGKGRAYPSDFGFQPLVERCERRSSTSPSLVPLAAELRWCRGPISFSGGSPMVSLAPCIQYIDA